MSKTALEFDQIHSLERVVTPFSLEAITFTLFCSKSYVDWWAGWKRNFLYRSTNLYYLLLNLDFADSSTEVRVNFQISFFFRKYYFVLITHLFFKDIDENPPMID